MKLTSRNGKLSCIGCLLALPWIFLLVLIAGCPLFGGGNTNDNDNDNGNDNTPSGNARILTPASSFGMSLLDPPFQVRYTVPGDATDVTGYRFPVADSSLNSPAIGEEVTIAVNLLAGSDRFFDFDPSEAGIGRHRVGVSFTVDGESDFAESAGVIQVQGPPDPIFIQPDQELTVVESGGVVTVAFDARDPEGEVQWRLFILDGDDTLTAPPDRLGLQIAVGEGNAGSVSFRTEGLPESTYTLGLSATDSGMSVAATVAAGQLDRIVTIPTTTSDPETPRIQIVGEGEVLLPTITITNPGTSDVTLYLDETFTIEFTASVPQEGATGAIEVFYDTDTNVNNGFTLIAEDLTEEDTEVEFPSDVPDGTYFIGATIRDGINVPVTDYAAGRVIVTRTVTLTVTEPNTTLTVAPNAPVTIRWTTNAPDDAGTVDVFAQRLNASNQPVGGIIPIVTEGNMSLRTAVFSSATSGLFQITVRLNLEEGAPITQTAPRPVRVSTLPAVAWIGSIAGADPELDGAIFGGVNFEDNAGSSFAKADDFDDDGLNEFIIGARYAKPFFVNPSGIGVGEAYLIFGERGAQRLSGTYNLNSVGTSSLRGVTLTGIRTENNTGVTEGLSDVLSIPDADGDDKDELMFGFPKVDSRDIGYGRAVNLSQDGQFLGGGVVIVSSTNDILAAPTEGNPVINLDLVGQQFNNATGLAIFPFDVDLALADNSEFEEAEDPVDPGECVEGGDNVVETVIGPGVGFIDFDYDPATLNFATPRIGLAISQAWDLYPDGRDPLRLFSPVNALFEVPPAPAEELCPTLIRLTLNRCVTQGAFYGLNSGSGFYVNTSTPAPPFGARIVGRELDDRFGTTLTLNEAAQTGGSAELIFSAPSRSASCLEVGGACIECEIQGVNCNDNLPDTGIAYITRNRNFWGQDAAVPGAPPTPHQYIMNRESHCSTPPDLRAEPIFFRPELAPSGFNNPAAGAAKVAGDSGDQIQNLLGIRDFNDDSLNDLAIGAPQADGGNGRVYIAYRRQGGSLGLEGDFLLEKLALDPNAPDRLDGLLISSTTADSLGSSLAGGFDFNGDNISDVAIGSPGAGAGTGEVIIVFGGTGIVSPVGGISVAALLTQTRTATGGPAAVRIRGTTVGGEKGLFGFNVANAGDVDNDGLNDLLIAAPEASPRFDPDPNDGVDELTALGLDLNLDGVRDEVPGDDQLLKAGLVYVILGENRLDQLRTCQGTAKSCTTAADCPAGTGCTLTDPTINISELGGPRLRGAMFAGRRAGDRLGGGDASDPDLGGIDQKDFGRGEGLGSAGDVDGDGRDDLLISALVADPRRDPNTGTGVRNGGEAYLIYGSNVP